jgi:tyrosyl-tRNA synthetase
MVVKMNQNENNHENNQNEYDVQSPFLKEVIERGFLYQCSDLESLDKLLLQKKIAAYSGYDMTAKSLHVGNLVQIMLTKWFEKCGHDVVILLGGGTSRIGDPSDKNEARPMLTDENIMQNMNSISQVFLRIFDNPKIVNNADWLDKLGYIDLLREVGTCFSVNKMVNLEIFRRRLNDNLNLSFLEFNYLILQSYDFLNLYRSHKCQLQFGGSDQWANILHGAELIRRKENEDAFAFTTPLITTADGKKMGKSVNGAVWLNANMKSPYDYWQFWRNTADNDVGKFLRLYTFIPLNEIKEMEKAQGADLNAVKVILANAATEIMHGKDAVANLHNTFTAEVEINESTSIIDILKMSKICLSNSEAKQLIRAGAVKIENEVVQDEKYCIDCIGEEVISVGKNKKILVKSNI